MATYTKERTLEETATWAVAVVCFVLLAISIFIEHFIHLVEKFLKKRKKVALVEAVEKVKAELMLLGFISLMLTILQTPISNICVSKKTAQSWLPCGKPFKKEEAVTEKLGRRLFEYFNDGSSFDDEFPARRSLATKGYDSCTGKGKYAFVTAYGIHQLHIFIFVLAIMHVIYCITTLALGNIKMRRWKQWEKETKTLEYTYHNDPQRFRYARDTSFGRRHLHFWSQSTILLWIVSFFRQFFRSVTKVDYLALRHGFIAAHLPPGAETRFDFQKYIHRSLEEDFKVIVGISPVIWLAAVLFLLTNTHGWYSYLWLPFASLVLVLLVGTKLQVIITRLGLRIQERGNVVKGTPVVQPGDELFWFGKPRFLLFVIHFVLFQNAFQMAFFAWSTYSFKFKNCFHPDLDDIIIRIAMGVFIQVLCSYVTLPLYALVTQMGSTMKATVFNDQVATALKQWHHTAKKQTKHNKHAGDASSHMSASSRPMTPLNGTSPLHLLQNQNQKVSSHEISPHPSPSPPRASNFDNVDWEDIDLQFRRHDDEDVEEEVREPEEYIVQRHLELNSAEHANGEEAIDISLSNYSVQK